MTLLPLFDEPADATLSAAPPTAWTPDLSRYDWIILNSSAGKDSQAMLDVVVEQCDQQHVPRARLVVAHADLGRVEWPGTRALAAEQARHYGLEFVAIARPQGDLLQHIARRGKFPSPKVRFCTSDHKRAQVQKLFTQLTARTRSTTCRTVHILNCLGLRASESPARARRARFNFDPRSSNCRRHVDQWLPLHDWSTAAVWQRIRQSNVRSHPAYALGMPRLSCCFCIFSPRAALLLAGRHNPELLDAYVTVERQIGHRFRPDLALTDIQAALLQPEAPGTIPDWTM